MSRSIKGGHVSATKNTSLGWGHLNFTVGTAAWCFARGACFLCVFFREGAAPRKPRLRARDSVLPMGTITRGPFAQQIKISCVGIFLKHVLKKKNEAAKRHRQFTFGICYQNPTGRGVVAFSGQTARAPVEAPKKRRNQK